MNKYKFKQDKIFKINGVNVPSVHTLLKKIPWRQIYDGIPSKIHGDLQFDNIIFDKKKFNLFDWREDFGGKVEYGDLYYDLSKMYGGLDMTYDII